MASKDSRKFIKISASSIQQYLLIKININKLDVKLCFHFQSLPHWFLLLLTFFLSCLRTCALRVRGPYYVTNFHNNRKKKQRREEKKNVDLFSVITITIVIVIILGLCFLWNPFCSAKWWGRNEKYYIIELTALY